MAAKCAAYPSFVVIARPDGVVNLDSDFQCRNDQEQPTLALLVGGEVELQNEYIRTLPAPIYLSLEGRASALV